ncbi:hypothetical protein Tco_0356509 [Tanacetum coccineum]
MSWLPKCVALKERVGGWEWKDMMVLYCQMFAAEDYKFAKRIKLLLEEMLAAYEERVDFIRELEIVPDVAAAVKTTEFLNETLWKDDKRLHFIRELETVPDVAAAVKTAEVLNETL